MSRRMFLLILAGFLGLGIAVIANAGYEWIAIGLLAVIGLGIFWIDV